MHKLTRPTPPACLGKLDYTQHTWDNAVYGNAPIQDEIWEKLQIMQTGRCAYCERDISRQQDRHIDHFHPRHPSGQTEPSPLTFKWSNLFGSCYHPDSCGNHKQNNVPGRNIIKPAVVYPEQFLAFALNGELMPHPGLAPAAARANDTIAFFNLNGSARKSREDAAAEFVEEFNKFQDNAQDALTADDLASWLQSELTECIGKPFETAIRHILQWMLDRV